MDKTEYEWSLSLDGLYHFPEIIYDDLINNYTKYLHFISSNKGARRIFIDLCQDVDNFLSRRNNKLDYHYKSLSSQVDKFNRKIYIYQTGGVNALSIICSILGGTIITALIAYFVYKWFTRPVCKPSYPLYSADVDLTIKDVLLRLVPKYFLPNADLLDSDTFIQKINDKIMTLAKPFNILDTSTLLKKIGVNIFRVGTSLIADIATEGAGGDILIDIVFDVKSVLDVLQAIIAGLLPIADDQQAIRFLHDIFSIDFKDGPFGVKCWVEFILKSYGKDSQVYRVVCSFFNDLLDSLSNFIGNIIATTIPDSLGLPAIFANTIITYAKKHAYGYAISFINSKYNKIPYDKQILIRNPQLMRGYFESKLRLIHILFIRKYGRDTYDAILKNSEFFGVAINKIFAFTYATLYSLQECSTLVIPTGEVTPTEETPTEELLLRKPNLKNKYTNPNQRANKSIITSRPL